MKMAKASKDDIEKCIKFFQFLEEFFEDGTYTETDNDEPERLTEEEFLDRLRQMWGGRWKPPGVDCSWMRVVFGCDILIDNACDPNADTLEWKPELAAKLDIDAEAIRQAARRVLEIVGDKPDATPANQGLKAGREEREWELRDLRKLKERVDAFERCTGIDLDPHNYAFSGSTPEQIAAAVKVILHGDHSYRYQIDTMRRAAHQIL